MYAFIHACMHACLLACNMYTLASVWGYVLYCLAVVLVVLLVMESATMGMTFRRGMTIVLPIALASCDRETDCDYSESNHGGCGGGGVLYVPVLDVMVACDGGYFCCCI